MNEEWRPVVGFEDFYEVSSLGRIRSFERVHTLTSRASKQFSRVFPARMVNPTRCHKKQYVAVMLSGGGKKLRRMMQGIVAEAFHGPKPTGTHQAAHLDGNAQNNRADNIAWVTPQENQAHRKAHGTKLEGERHPRAKLTAEKVRQLRAAAEAENVGARTLSRRFGIPTSTVHHIIKRENWRSIEA